MVMLPAYLRIPILLCYSFLLLCGGPLSPAHAQESPLGAPSQVEPTRLAVVWTSGDREVALNVAFMYTLNAKTRGWFDEVALVVWGPSAELLSRDEELQHHVLRMAEADVALLACKACADSYGVSEELAELGVEVKYMGEPLSEMLKGDWRVITF